MVLLLCDIVSLVYFIYIPKIIENIANIHCTGNISIRLLVIFIRTQEHVYVNKMRTQII